MGIDRHELEHRNWRSSVPVKTIENSGELPEDSGISIVPDDIALAESNAKPDLAKPRTQPRAKRAKAD